MGAWNGHTAILDIRGAGDYVLTDCPFVPMVGLLWLLVVPGLLWIACLLVMLLIRPV
jgi:hypothetical protein